MTKSKVLTDQPSKKILRLTLNRPEKRNALNDEIRQELFDALRNGDRDKNISVMIIRGSGEAFSAGYDLSQPNHDVERSIAKTDGWWSRHVVNNWFEIWDMSTPGIILRYDNMKNTTFEVSHNLEDKTNNGISAIRLMYDYIYITGLRSVLSYQRKTNYSHKAGFSIIKLNEQGSLFQIEFIYKVSNGLSFRRQKH